MDVYKEVYNDGTIRLTHSEHGWGMQMPPAATTLLVSNNKIILIEDKKTEKDRWLWNCPGGMVEAGETTEQAAARECEEETGFIPTTLEKFASIETDFPSTYVDYFIGSRLKQGKRPDVDSMAALARWAGISLDAFVIDAPTPGEEVLRDLVAQSNRLIEATIREAYRNARAGVTL